MKKRMVYTPYLRHLLWKSSFFSPYMSDLPSSVRFRCSTVALDYNVPSAIHSNNVQVKKFTVLVGTERSPLKVPSDEESDASVSDHLTTIDRSTERKRKPTKASVLLDGFDVEMDEPGRSRLLSSSAIHDRVREGNSFMCPERAGETTSHVNRIDCTIYWYR